LGELQFTNPNLARTQTPAPAKQGNQHGETEQKRKGKKTRPAIRAKKNTGIKRINPATREKKTEIKRISDAHKHCTTRGSGTG
jgi:hypothetical protein